MTDEEIYNALDKGGVYSLPFLVQFKEAGMETIYLVNNNENVTYLGNTYIASAFKYTPPKLKGGVIQGGSLECSTKENALASFIDATTHTMSVNVVGIITEDGNVSPMALYKHQYGNVTIDNGFKLNFSFTNDDRFSLVFPPVVFDNENNPGNA